MPIFTPDTVKTDNHNDPDDPCGPTTAQLFSDAGGLTQFGAFIEILPPGSASSIKHWHAGEDEMIYMISGEAILYEGDTATPLLAGQGATFKAGDPQGHCLRNESASEVRYMVIGTRSAGDVVTYPDHDRVLYWERATKTRRYTTLDGAPAGTPYTKKG